MLQTLLNIFRLLISGFQLNLITSIKNILLKNNNNFNHPFNGKICFLPDTCNDDYCSYNILFLDSYQDMKILFIPCLVTREFVYFTGYSTTKKMTEISEILLDRRTIRKYSSQSVDDKLLNDLLSMGCRASTTGNMQVYSIIISRDEEKKKELAPFHFNQKMITEAPVVLTFCADFNRFNKWCKLRKAEPGYDNFLSFMTAATDALLVAQTFCIAAESKGLGICYLGTTIYNAHKIIEVLKLPKGVVPITTVSLGWPDENPEQIDRLPLEAIIHKEVYCDYSSERIEMYYREKEERNDSRQFVNENKKETLAQVFTDVRYKKADNIYFSEILLQVLKDQGFL
jgi:nitroreductase